MSFDITKISPKGRERYLRVGRRYGSSDTVKQASKTLNALELHSVILAAHGFGAEDAVQLGGARGALIAAGVGRNEKAGEKKTTSKSYLAAIKSAKASRARGQTILTNTCRELEDAGDEETVRNVETALSQVRALPDEGEKLAAQLDLLRTTLLETKVADAAKKRGGIDATTALESAAMALRAAADEREMGGTQLSTEEMDVLDGIIVLGCRAAKNAARQAALALSQPAILTAFALTHISARSPGEAGEAGDATDEPEAGGKAAEGTVTATSTPQ